MYRMVQLRHVNEIKYSKGIHGYKDTKLAQRLSWYGVIIAFLELLCWLINFHKLQYMLHDVEGLYFWHSTLHPFSCFGPRVNVCILVSKRMNVYVVPNIKPLCECLAEQKYFRWTRMASQ